jgi:two-component system OmpR family response regulator
VPAILIIDDDAHIREVVCFALRAAGFEVHEAEDGKVGLEVFDSLRPDLVVLDILMPEQDGLAVCRRIRALARTPVIFLTSVDDVLDRVVGLELGADDYVTKPFSPRELVARVRSVLRRVAEAPKQDEPRRFLEHGALRLDLEAYTVSCAGRVEPLSATERGILAALMGHPSKVWTRGELMDRAYLDGSVVSERTIDSHVKRLRKKLFAVGCDAIDTVHGVGYRLRTKGQW